MILILMMGTGCGDNQDNPTLTPVIRDIKESPPIEALYPIPTSSQIEWQNAEMTMFVHFGMGTFVNQEWADGTEDPKFFTPGKLDANQWVSIAKEIGFTSIILTAKHHDGFCLWPSKYTSHTLARSRYMNGAGDIVRDVSEACRQYGLKFGIYLSPWDRHEKTYGTAAYNVFFRNQLTELLTGYGDIGEVWFDGANGDPTRTQVYDWDLFYSTVRHYQPQAVVANVGPDVRWIGNENGLGNETEWSPQPQALAIQSPAFEGKVWWPSESDVSIRNGWFYHPWDDGLTKSVGALTAIYVQTVGRNSNLLLNVPPNRDGLIADVDIARLRAWRRQLDNIFAHNIFKGQSITASSVRNNSPEYAARNCLDENRKTFWAAPRDTTTAVLTIEFKKNEIVNVVWLEEAIEYGQRIQSFRILYDDGNGWTERFRGSTIGRSRIVAFPPIITGRLKIVIDRALAAPTLRILKGYYSPLSSSFHPFG